MSNIITTPAPDMLSQCYVDWNNFPKHVLGIDLDADQREIMSSVQHNKRTSVRSCHARGKDYVGAAVALTFLNLFNKSKVILTAPSYRQVIKIMMAEVGDMYMNSRIPLGGELQKEGIIYSDNLKHYLLGFKTSDISPSMWTGFHSTHVLLIISEASGVADTVFKAAQGLMTGTIVRLLLLYNPNLTSGEAYNSSRNPQYKTFTLGAMDSVNVKAKKIIIPGQVDWEYVNDMVQTPGLTQTIRKEEMEVGQHDFKWEGQCYRPSDDFLVKVLGEYPRTSSGALISLSWVEASNNMYDTESRRIFDLEKEWLKCEEREREKEFPGVLFRRKIGLDVAGMGRDKTVFMFRVEGVDDKGIPFDLLYRSEVYAKKDPAEVAGIAINYAVKRTHKIFVDTIGEGAGVHPLLLEAKCLSYSAKSSEGADGLTDKTKQRKFHNMRAYMHWRVRDNLDPQFGHIPGCGSLVMMPHESLKQEATVIGWKFRSDGSIIIEEKDLIKKKLGRSDDDFDALNLSYYPYDSPAISFM